MVLAALAAQIRLQAMDKREVIRLLNLSLLRAGVAVAAHWRLQLIPSESQVAQAVVREDPAHQLSAALAHQARGTMVGQTLELITALVAVVALAKSAKVVKVLGQVTAVMASPLHLLGGILPLS